MSAFKVCNARLILVGAGSIYVLMIVAVQELRHSLASSAGTLATDVGNLLRWPDGTPVLDISPAADKNTAAYVYVSDTMAGKMVSETIIPAVELLARICPIHIGDILQSSVLSGSGVSGSTLCSDLIISDHVFTLLKVKYVYPLKF